MGESRKDALRLDFDHKLKPEFHGTKVTNDAGCLHTGNLMRNSRTNRGAVCNSRKETSAMNSKRNKPGALIVTAFVLAIGGCAVPTTDVTHEYRASHLSEFDDLTKADAAEALTGLAVSAIPWEPIGSRWQIHSANETSFDIYTLVEGSPMVVSGTLLIPKKEYHGGRFHSRVLFAEVTRIELYSSDTSDYGVVGLYTKRGRIGGISVTGELIGKVPAALLVLCPNVK